MQNLTVIRALCAICAVTFSGVVEALEQIRIKQIRFKQLDACVGAAEHQTILTGRFSGGGMSDILLIDAQSDNANRLRILVHDERDWHTLVDEPLPSEVAFVDVARIADRDCLIAYDDERFVRFNLDTQEFVEFAKAAIQYGTDRAYAGAESTGPYDVGEIPHIDVTRDVNGDGLDDIVLPDVDGFWILTQTLDGSFAAPVKLGPPETYRAASAFDEKRTYGEFGLTPLTIPWYLDRVYGMDYDGDARRDLVFWNDGRFDVYAQDAGGGFARDATSFEIAAPIDSDGAYSLMFAFSDRSPAALFFGLGRKTRHTVLCAVRDLNGDGVADLLTHTLTGRSLLRQRSRYEAYFGKATPGAIAFAEQPDAVVQPRSRAGGMAFSGYSKLWLDDFDANGEIDLLRGDVKMGPVAMIRAMRGVSLTLRAELFLMENDAYEEEATAAQSITTEFDPTGGRDEGFFPCVLVGDVNGDGASDVIAAKSREQLLVFAGGHEGIGVVPHEIDVAVPGDERNSWLADLNDDGKQDVVMHQQSSTGPNRVSFLIAE